MDVKSIPLPELNQNSVNAFFFFIQRQYPSGFELSNINWNKEYVVFLGWQRKKVEEDATKVRNWKVKPNNDDWGVFESEESWAVSGGSFSYLLDGT